MEIRSSAFENGGMIPLKYTCDGADVSPPLEWSGAPEGTKALVLIADDPDAPVGTWVHWVAYNIPVGRGGLPEGVPPTEEIEGGGRQGVNDFRRIGYGGPCPPSGTHRYYFKLYALDREIDPGRRATKAALLEAMKGHVLGEVSLMGKYAR